MNCLATTALADQIQCTKELNALSKCQIVIQDCKGVNDALKAEVAACNSGFEQANAISVRQTHIIAEKDEQLSRWYRNPGIVLSVGIVLGIILEGMIRK